MEYCLIKYQTIKTHLCDFVFLNINMHYFHINMCDYYTLYYFQLNYGIFFKDKYHIRC